MIERSEAPAIAARCRASRRPFIQRLGLCQATANSHFRIFTVRAMTTGGASLQLIYNDRGHLNERQTCSIMTALILASERTKVWRSLQGCQSIARPHKTYVRLRICLVP